jgi:hypothetical protein
MVLDGPIGPMTQHEVNINEPSAETVFLATYPGIWALLSAHQPTARAPFISHALPP